MPRHSHDGSSAAPVTNLLVVRHPSGRRSISPTTHIHQAFLARNASAPLASSGQLRSLSRERYATHPDYRTLAQEALPEEDPQALAELEDQEEQERQQRAQEEESYGRITVFCIAEQLDCKRLEALINADTDGYTCQTYTEVIYMRTPYSATDAPGEVFFFSYGVVAFWNCTQTQEEKLLAAFARPCQSSPLRDSEMQVDELRFIYSSTSPPHIQNDTITIHRKQAGDHRVKLALSHALAQSSKLSVYETRIMSLVEEVRHLPQGLAKYGHVQLSRKQIAQLMGKVFLQKSAVNLLSHVLDTPEYFWRAPDSLQALYERACEYQELETRIDLVNARFEVLGNIMDVLHDHTHNKHFASLDLIVMWLVLVEVVLAFAEVIGILRFSRY